MARHIARIETRNRTNQLERSLVSARRTARTADAWAQVGLKPSDANRVLR